MSAMLQGAASAASRPLIPLTIHITVPSNLNVSWVKGFIYVPEANETKPLNIIYSILVPIVEGKVTFPSNELSHLFEFQVFAVDNSDRIVAGRRGFADELLNFESSGLELHEC